MAEQRLFTGGLNQDADERLIAPGDYRYALNVRNVTNDADGVGTVQNVRGNAKVPYTLPGSDSSTGVGNKVIGAVKYEPDNTIYYFVWGESEKHSILEYNSITGKITKVLQNEILAFSKDEPITSANVIEVTESDLDATITTTESVKLLYWTDNINPPRKINIEKAILHSAGDYTNGYSQRLSDGNLTTSFYNNIPEREVYIDAVKYPPKDRPTITLQTDGSVLTNEIRGNMFQFKYRYVYDDNEKSAWSPISECARTSKDGLNLVLANSAGVKDDNRVRITVKNFIDTVKKIEIATRERNEKNFYLIDVIDNNSDWFATEATASDRVQSTQNVLFYNTGNHRTLALEDSTKLYDSVPILAKAQDIVGSRLMYGNIVDGFDLLETNLTTPSVATKDKMNVRLTPYYHQQQIGNNIDLTNTIMNPPLAVMGQENDHNFNSSDILKTSMFFLSPIDFNTIPVNSMVDGALLRIDITGEYNIQLKNWINLVNVVPSTEDFDFSFSWEKTVNEGETALDLADDFNSQNHEEFTQGGTHPHQIFIVQNGTLCTIIFKYSHPEEWDKVKKFNSHSSTVTASINPSGANKQSFKAGAKHDFGLVYYDRANRSSNVNRCLDSSCYIEWFSSRVPFGQYNDGRGASDIYWNLLHDPPQWATHYQWVYAKNQTVDEFVQYIVAERRKDVEKNLYISLKSLKTSDATDASTYVDGDGALLEFHPMKGDFLRVISRHPASTAYAEGNRIYVGSYKEFPIADVVVDPVIKDNNNEDQQLTGFFLKLADPDIDGYATGNIAVNSTEDLDEDEVFDGLTGTQDEENSNDFWLNAVVEIYRKKDTDESRVYYEFSDTYAIRTPGNIYARHKGETRGQEEAALGSTNLVKATTVYSHFTFHIANGTSLKVGDLVEIADVTGTGQDSNINTTHTIVKQLDDVGGNDVWQTLTKITGTFSEVSGDGTLTRPKQAAGVFTNGDVYFKTRRMRAGGITQSVNKVNTSVNIEDEFYNDFAKTKSIDIGRVHIYVENSRQQRRYATVVYSDVFSTGSEYNGLSDINYAVTPFRDYNIGFGSIQKLSAKEDNLYIYQENKVSKVLVNKDIITKADGNQDVALTSEVLSEQTPLLGDYGISYNPESHTRYGGIDFWVDIRRSAVLALEADKIMKLSDLGMKDFFRDKTEEYFSLTKSLNIYGAYNPKYDEYVMHFEKLLYTVIDIGTAGSIVDDNGNDIPHVIDNDYDTPEHRNTSPAGAGTQDRDGNPLSGLDKNSLQPGNVLSQTDNNYRSGNADPNLKQRSDDTVAVNVQRRVDSKIKNKISQGSGTVAINNGSASLTGSSSAFTTEAEAGQLVYVKDSTISIGTIQSIGSDTAITLASSYSGDNLSGKSYVFLDGTNNRVTNARALKLDDLAKNNVIPISPSEAQFKRAGTKLPTRVRADIGGSATYVTGLHDLGKDKIELPEGSGSSNVTLKETIKKLSGVTIAFSPIAKKFTTFYSYEPDTMINLHSRLYSFKNGALYIHDKSEVRNNFYGNQYSSMMIVVSNENPSENKTYQTLKIEGNQPWSINDLKTNLVETNSVSLGSPAIDKDRLGTSEDVRGVGQISSTVGNTAVTGNGTEFLTTVKAGDVVKYDITTLGTVASVTSNTALVLTNGASATLANEFAYIAEEESQLLEKEGMFYTTLTRANVESFGGSKDKGTNLKGLGTVSITNNTTTLTGASTASEFTSAANVGDTIKTGDGGSTIGVVASITNNQTIVLEQAYTGATLTNVFSYAERPATIEGDKYKGYYLQITIENDSTEPIELYGINFNYGGKASPPKTKTK